jgi:hypothetical protein
MGASNLASSLSLRVGCAMPTIRMNFSLCWSFYLIKELLGIF